MGVRGELFSTRLILPNRTYFFNVKENRMGDLYLNVVESKGRETGGFERQSVIVFAEDLQSFLGKFDEALKELERTLHEQKRSGRKRWEDDGYDRYEDKRSGDRPLEDENSGRSGRKRWEDDGYDRYGDQRPGDKPPEGEDSGRSGRKRWEDGYDRYGDQKPGDKPPEDEEAPRGEKWIVVREREDP
ncbi:MAG: DUF3276 family protein [Spirochaetaceae bacterium]|nr:DUF3276 family protein [Spirochaetaceae bacterium]